MKLTLQDILPIKNELLCALCKNLLRDPTNFDKCSHNFCWKCIMEKSEGVCPCCKNNQIDNLKRDSILNELVNLYERLNEGVSLEGSKSKDAHYGGKISDVKVVINKIKCEDLKLNQNSEINKRDLNRICKVNKKGETPLHQAAIKGDVQKAVKFVENIKNMDGGLQMLSKIINATDYAGWTALHEACNHGKNDMVLFLLENGAEIDFCGCENETPLHDAVANGHISCVRMLLQHHANINIRNSMGLLPIDYATDETIKSLLQERASLIVHQNIKGISPESSLDLVKTEFKDLAILTSGAFDKNSEITQLLDEFKSVLKAKILEKYEPMVSHLVIFGCLKLAPLPNNKLLRYAAPKRNLKYLISILKGKWIVHSEWLKNSVKHKKLLDETEYELCGYGRDIKFNETMAPKKARLSQISNKPGLFAGCKFYLKGNFKAPSMSRGEIVTLIKMGDGQILVEDPTMDKLNPLHNLQCFHVDQSHSPHHFLNKSCAIIIIPNSISKPFKSKRRSGSMEKNDVGENCKKYLKFIYEVGKDGVFRRESEAFKSHNQMVSVNNIIPVLDTDWILDSISRFELIDYNL